MTTHSNASTTDSDKAALALVLSPERSGSTLLASMLGANTRIVAPPELFLLRYPDFDTWRAEKPEASASLAWLMRSLGQDAGERAIARQFRAWPTPDVYRWLLERLGPMSVLIDKTPAYGRDRAALARAELLAPRYIWLRRHPLGVANSWVERRRARRWRFTWIGRAAAARLARARAGILKRLNADLDRSAVAAALQRWCLVHETVADFADQIGSHRVFTLSYEELLQAPRSTLEPLCDWLGVAFEPAMLEPWKHLPDTLAWGIGDELIRSHERIDKSRAESWRAGLDETDLDDRTRAVLARLKLDASGRDRQP